MCISCFFIPWFQKILYKEPLDRKGIEEKPTTTTTTTTTMSGCPLGSP